MAVAPGFRDFVVEQLGHVAPITARSMFGGVGLYAHEHFFALLHDDRLYFKVDETNRPDFERHGMDPFRPYGDERTMNYYEVPVEVLEDLDALERWTAAAVDVARRSRRPKRRA